MRRWSSRAFGFTVATLLAGCAALASFKEPLAEDDEDRDPVARNDASTPRPEQPSPVDAGVYDSAALEGDGAVVPEPPKPTPVVCAFEGGAPNGDSCTQPSQCCSGACDENRQCDSSCQALDKPCNPNRTGECCIRSYCSPALRQLIPPETWCTKCREKGTSAETARNIFNQVIILPHSCCSGVQKDGVCE